MLTGGAMSRKLARSRAGVATEPSGDEVRVVTSTQEPRIDFA